MSMMCTLGDVRALMQKRDNDTGQDDLIAQLIPAAETAALLFADRQFAPKETAVMKTFEFAWESRLVNLAPYDLRGQPTLVKIDTDVESGGLTLNSEEFRTWPNPARDGTFLQLRVQPLVVALGRVQWPTRQIQITGNWGFPEVPEDVVHAVAATVAHWLTVNYRRPDEDPLSTFMPQRGLSPDAYDILLRYKRAVTV